MKTKRIKNERGEFEIISGMLIFTVMATMIMVVFTFVFPALEEANLAEETKTSPSATESTPSHEETPDKKPVEQPSPEPTQKATPAEQCVRSILENYSKTISELDETEQEGLNELTRKLIQLGDNPESYEATDYRDAYYENETAFCEAAEETIIKEIA